MTVEDLMAVIAKENKKNIFFFKGGMQVWIAKRGEEIESIVIRVVAGTNENDAQSMIVEPDILVQLKGGNE